MARRLLALLVPLALVVAACTPSAPPAIRVTAVSPTLGQADVEVNTAVSTTFNTAITQSTLEGAFSLSSEGGAVAGTLSYDADTRVATFTPDEDLDFETEYTATWSTTLRATNNGRLARDYAWTFTTVEAEEEPEEPEDPAVNSVTVSPVEVELEIAATAQLAADVDAVGGADDSVTWASDNEDVATVDEDGLVTAVAAGTATVTATSVFNDEVSGSATVTVLATDVLSVVVEPGEATLDVGETQQLEATVEVVSGADESVTWESSDATVATVDEDGLVTAVAPGTATVTATSVENAAVSSSATINVVGVTDVIVDPDTVDLLVGDTSTLTADVTALHGADDSVVWTTSDAAIATVDEDGIVTAVAGGVATITATSVFNDEVSGSATVNVQTVTAVTVTPEAADLAVGGTATLAAAVTATGGADESVTWTSDNEAVATVDGDGVVTAVSVGVASITATSDFDDTVAGLSTVTVHGALVVDHFVPTTLIADTGVLAEDLGVSGGLASYTYDFTVTPPAGWPEDYADVPYDDISEVGVFILPPATVTVDGVTGTLVGSVAESEIDPDEAIGYWAFFIEVTDSLGQIDHVFVELAVQRDEP